MQLRMSYPSHLSVNEPSAPRRLIPRSPMKMTSAPTSCSTRGLSAGAQPLDMREVWKGLRRGIKGVETESVVLEEVVLVSRE